jgi:hypothetical protein
MLKGGTERVLSSKAYTRNASSQARLTSALNKVYSVTRYLDRLECCR